MKKLPCLIKKLFQGCWRSISFVRNALANLIFIFLLCAIYVLYNSAQPSNQSAAPKALVLDLKGTIVEQSSQGSVFDMLSESLLDKSEPKENRLYEIVQTLRHAKDDKQISGLVLDLGEMADTPLTKLQYIGKALKEFKDTGKPIYAVGDFYNQSQYFLASYADKIMLSPDGGVLIKGYSSYSVYLNALLNKLDVTAHVFKVGTYKSAIEPLIRNDMSPEAKRSASRWLDQMWSAYANKVAQNRNLSVSVLNPSEATLTQLLQSTKGDIALLTQKMGLVDELANRVERRQELVKRFGQNDADDHDDDFNHISYYRYKDSYLPLNDPELSDIGVIDVSGTIVDGSGTASGASGDLIAQRLRLAKEDKKIKAVIIRVDSPGGSAFASEVIRNEIEALKQSGKPVVVSMSSLAASGGYWLSVSADKIVADPVTLTGSIGVFSVITTFEKSLKHLGIQTDGVSTTPFAQNGVTTGLTPAFSQLIQLTIDHTYHRFTQLVATERGLSSAQVEAAAQGQVWTGKDALDRGLVDKLGDFDDAVRLAAQLAKLTEYQLFWVTEPLSPVQELLNQFVTQVSAASRFDLLAWLPQSLKPLAKEVLTHSEVMSGFNDPKAQYVFCLNCQMY